MMPKYAIEGESTRSLEFSGEIEAKDKDAARAIMEAKRYIVWWRFAKKGKT
tara:strand:+ start:259 stop:411 length:153 start_codon:yes stop_codon:yes gene_type:complete